MRAMVRRIARGIGAIERAGARGIRRWSATPVGVQIGLIVGFLLAFDAWGGAAWTALLLFLWSLPGWLERVTPGSIKRLLAAFRRNPWLAIFAVSAAPLSLLHPVVLAAETAGDTGAAGAVIGLLIPLLMGIPPASPASPAGPFIAVVGPAGPAWTGTPFPATEPSFVVRPGTNGPSSEAGRPSSRRLTNVSPSIITLIGAAMVVVATFVPWATVTLPTYGTVDLDGLYGQDHMLTDGGVTLVMGTILAVAGMARLGARGPAGWRRGLAIAAGMGLATLSVWLIGAIRLDMAQLIPPAIGAVGPGAVAVGFGGAIAMVGGLLPGRPVQVPAVSASFGAAPTAVVRRSRTGLFARGQR